MPSEDKTGASRSTIEEAADLVATSVQEGFDDVLRAARAYARDHQGAAARQMNDYAEAAGADTGHATTQRGLTPFHLRSPA